jgi:phthiocerol/phenolphthiocerol synthesis type-I polyketide synthase E
MASDKYEGIAIIGVGGRFPGANNIDEFWHNLVNGIESISHFSDDELEVSGPSVKEANYVKARGMLNNADLFDASFFGITPREAEFTDPQHRIFLECAWEALENAGYDAKQFSGPIGVYAGCSLNTYLLHNLCTNRTFIEETLAGHQMSANPALLGNDKDFLATRVSYKLDLHGPSVVIQTACSTSLVAVCHAYQSLLNYQCDIALAGGVSISFPQKRGYQYQEGAMVSSDGRCRPFDASAGGTIFGGGVGIVIMRRLTEAIEARDNIIAVIKGAAINNDGSAKVSYMAPSVDAQAEVIAMAQALAGISPDEISYVEAHGTGTPLGDPIEIAGLTKAFREGTDATGFCAVGSVKGNIGHLESAAGVTGLIKTALALKHQQIPPSIHFVKPNPECHFEKSPFYVVSALTEWKNDHKLRRAGVSSFGVGGTNAHVVLEEAPSVEPSHASRSAQMLLLSARSPGALDCATDNLKQHLQAHPELELSDIAFTLQAGRRRFNHRRSLVCHNASEAIDMLGKPDSKSVFTQCEEKCDPPIAFLFPGQGAQYVNMGRNLYQSEQVFRQEVDRCCQILLPQLGLDLRHVLYPPSDQAEASQKRLTETWLTQPALFVIEYAMARLLVEWGIKPSAMIGHSVGEYVAACLSEVFSLEDGLSLLATRARLMQSLPAGSMLAVRAPKRDIESLLDGSLSIAAINSPQICVVSGPTPAVQSFAALLEERGIGSKLLATSHAFHSAMMDPMAEQFAAIVQKIKHSSPTIPYISNVTAEWITERETGDPDYWFKHLRGAVRFADGISELAKNPQIVFLEVGPGQTLSTLTRQNPSLADGQSVIATMPGTADGDEIAALLNSMGRLWVAGASINWGNFNKPFAPCRTPLPTYPFERKRYWIEPPKQELGYANSQSVPGAIEPKETGSPNALAGKNRDAGRIPASISQTVTSNSALEQVITDQLQLMELQVETLKQGRR